MTTSSSRTCRTGWYQSGPKYKVLAKDKDFDDLGEKGYAIKDLKKDVHDKDFFNYRQGSLSGYTFNDKNRDGYFNYDKGEDGLKDWVIRAYVDQNHNHQLDPVEYSSPYYQDTTDTNGHYLIDVTPGDYILVEVKQADWNQSAPIQSVASGFASLGQYGYAKFVGSGYNYAFGIDFGNYQGALIERV